MCHQCVTSLTRSTLGEDGVFESVYYVGMNAKERLLHPLLFRDGGSELMSDQHQGFFFLPLPGTNTPQWRLSVITAKDNLVCQWRRLGLKDRKYGNIQTWFPFQCKFNSRKTNDTLESIPVSFLFPNVFSLKPYLPSENIIWTEPKWPQAILVLHRSKYRPLPRVNICPAHAELWFTRLDSTHDACGGQTDVFFLQRAKRIVLYPPDMPQTAISMLLLSKVNKRYPPSPPPPPTTHQEIVEKH